MTAIGGTGTSPQFCGSNSDFRGSDPLRFSRVARITVFLSVVARRVSQDDNSRLVVLRMNTKVLPGAAGSLCCREFRYYIFVRFM